MAAMQMAAMQQQQQQQLPGAQLPGAQLPGAQLPGAIDASAMAMPVAQPGGGSQQQQQQQQQQQLAMAQLARQTSPPDASAAAAATAQQLQQLQAAQYAQQQYVQQQAAAVAAAAAQQQAAVQQAQQQLAAQQQQAQQAQQLQAQQQALLAQQQGQGQGQYGGGGGGGWGGGGGRGYGGGGGQGWNNGGGGGGGQWGGGRGGGGGGWGGGGGRQQGGSWNANAPAFAPGTAGGDGGATVPLQPDNPAGSGPSMVVRPGQHLTPTQQSQFVAGAALAGLRRTGQSSRHDALFLPANLRADLAREAAAAAFAGHPNDTRLEELFSVQARARRPRDAARRAAPSVRSPRPPLTAPFALPLSFTGPPVPLARAPRRRLPGEAVAAGGRRQRPRVQSDLRRRRRDVRAPLCGGRHRAGRGDAAGGGVARALPPEPRRPQGGVRLR